MSCMLEVKNQGGLPIASATWTYCDGYTACLPHRQTVCLSVPPLPRKFVTDAYCRVRHSDPNSPIHVLSLGRYRPSLFLWSLAHNMITIGIHDVVTSTDSFMSPVRSLLLTHPAVHAAHIPIWGFPKLWVPVWAGSL